MERSTGIGEKACEEEKELPEKAEEQESLWRPQETAIHGRILKQSGKETYIPEANPVKPPVLSESQPQAMDEVSNRCESERSGSVFAVVYTFLMDVR